ncbi:hypothetical protein EV200_108143 [Pedobacter psychrotolerans]|uniref:Uncharacterized protein n=1 Tax=Pedobacter psychrotolerans TaxID=1843235 RepID=A0A4R2H4Z3_9SPHI|nr:DUF5362 family protein [Pedobacter psychrotolerans]TCO20702.1 hypothetical protein EV200_108143 [Pedobacter psychrotolerans]GGE67415.1 hypothetical protein GCM10011413_37620 [Pedobacter psychrotolerans]
MEDLEEDVPQEVKLVVTEEMRSYIYDITRWAKFLSIVGFVFSVILILVSFTIPAMIASNPVLAKQLGSLGQGSSTAITIIYLILGLFYFYPSLLLFRISNNGKQGVLFGNQESLNTAMQNVKSLFKFWGIITITVIVGYFLLLFLVGAGLAVA